MFLYSYVNLCKGDLCIVSKETHPFRGHVVIFQELDYAAQCPLFVFEACERKKVVLHSEHDFQVIPYQESMRFLIDLAIQTRDEAWFMELTAKLRLCPE